ncbi:MAG: hypothetical protein ABII72_02655 [Parcubacteria group bacterium]
MTQHEEINPGELYASMDYIRNNPDYIHQVAPEYTIGISRMLGVKEMSQLINDVLDNTKKIHEFSSAVGWLLKNYSGEKLDEQLSAKILESCSLNETLSCFDKLSLDPSACKKAVFESSESYHVATFYPDVFSEVEFSDDELRDVLNTTIKAAHVPMIFNLIENNERANKLFPWSEEFMELKKMVNVDVNTLEDSTSGLDKTIKDEKYNKWFHDLRLLVKDNVKSGLLSLDEESDAKYLTEYVKQFGPLYSKCLFPLFVKLSRGDDLNEDDQKDLIDFLGVTATTKLKDKPKGLINRIKQRMTQMKEDYISGKVPRGAKSALGYDVIIMAIGGLSYNHYDYEGIKKTIDESFEASEKDERIFPKYLKPYEYNIPASKGSGQKEISMVPAVGLFRYLSPTMSDVCYEEDDLIGNDKPHVLLYVRKSKGGSDVVGSVSLIEAENADSGVSVLVVRANNPTENFLSTVNVDALIDASIETAMKISRDGDFGEVAVVIDKEAEGEAGDAATGAATNRRRVLDVYKRKYGKNRIIRLLDEPATNFIDTGIWDPDGSCPSHIIYDQNQSTVDTQ